MDHYPVHIAGRKIAESFWGKAWCDHMESFGDYVNRLPRGRSYVRNGSVCHLEIRGGLITAIVSGSTLYNVSITIAPLRKTKWDAVRSACTGKIGSLIDLLHGKLDRGVMEVVSNRNNGLFPLPGEMKFDCDCPDWAVMCKHVAAVLYGVGARLDHSPEMLFLLRGVNHEELVDVSKAVAGVAKAGSSRRRIAASGIADVFGIDLAETVEEVSEASAVPLASNPQTQEKPEGVPLPRKLTGKVIFAWRSSLGETQAVFASRIGVTATTISQWENKGKAAIGMQARTISAVGNAWKLTHAG
ncbi:MAG TPA: SWIM zinc finger family protein [Candidatus Deferrimicrobiaceae bacterium]